MKTSTTFVNLACFVLSLGAFSPEAAAQTCWSIKDGVITNSAGDLLQTGYDAWGYNYQARAYNGIYDNFTRPGTPYTDDTCSAAPYGCTTLQMKWNDAWLSNRDCNNDLKLDRASDPPSGTYRGSGAWLTNHMSGTCEVDGKEKHWTYFVKILAVPADAVLQNGSYYDPATGELIGGQVWQDFAVVQEVVNDPCTATHGLAYKAVHPGMGTQQP